MIRHSLFVTTLVLLISFTSTAQTTGFSYQGKLTDAGSPANGSFQMQFKLFDSLGGVGQIGSAITDVPVTVTQGTFSVKLDFGVSVFTGADRWLEVAVRHNSGESYTTLSPREQIASSPYSLRTLSAAQADDSLKLGGVDASEYITTANAGNTFIKNQTTPQAASNFNISGNGIVGGKVGIGTSSPVPALDIRGTGFSAGQRLTDTASGNSLVLQSGAGVDMKVTGYNYGSATAVPLYLSVDGANTILNSGGGNVGIGTSSPTNTLDVNGFFRAFNPAGGNVVSETTGGVNSWAKFWARTPAQLWSIGSSNGFNGNQLYFSNENPGGGIRMAIMPNGNVGIGTTAPAAKLSVDGNVGQNASSFGLPKAMLLVRENGNGQPFIEKCYNAVTNNVTAPCGIGVSQPGGLGIISVSFPFRVTDRFFSISPIYNSTLESYSHITGFDAGDISGGTVQVYAAGFQGNTADFYLIVY